MSFRHRAFQLEITCDVMGIFWTIRGMFLQWALTGLFWFFGWLCSVRSFVVLWIRIEPHRDFLTMMCFASVDALFAPEIFSRLLSFCGLFWRHTQGQTLKPKPLGRSVNLVKRWRLGQNNIILNIFELILGGPFFWQQTGGSEVCDEVQAGRNSWSVTYHGCPFVGPLKLKVAKPGLKKSRQAGIHEMSPIPILGCPFVGALKLKVVTALTKFTAWEPRKLNLKEYAQVGESWWFLILFKMIIRNFILSRVCRQGPMPQHADIRSQKIQKVIMHLPRCQPLKLKMVWA